MSPSPRVLRREPGRRSRAVPSPRLSARTRHRGPAPPGITGVAPGVAFEATSAAFLVGAALAVLNAVVAPILAALRLTFTLITGFLLLLAADASPSSPPAGEGRHGLLSVLGVCGAARPPAER